MIFRQTKLKGAYLIEIEKIEDERGFFARSWCQKEFDTRGINLKLVQCNISYNILKGTLRGMHFQIPPFSEGKLVRCTRGSIFDVIIDLRPESNTYTDWYGTELSSDNYHILYVPEGFAHGFITLEDHTELFYQMSEFYRSEAAQGVRWNDPAFKIEWPLPVKFINERDANYPDFEGIAL